MTAFWSLKNYHVSEYGNFATLCFTPSLPTLPAPLSPPPHSHLSPRGHRTQPSSLPMSPVPHSTLPCDVKRCGVARGRCVKSGGRTFAYTLCGSSCISLFLCLCCYMMRDGVREVCACVGVRRVGERGLPVSQSVSFGGQVL